MYIILTALIIIILYYYGNIIIEIVKFNSKSSNKFYVIGNSWFYGLLFVNIIILGFITAYYYYVMQKSVGKIGLSGYPGMKGVDGEPCEFSLC